MTSMHFYGWKQGLKTGMYYLRAKPAADAIKFTVDQSTAQAVKDQEAAKLACSRANPEGCLMCSA